MEKKLKKLLAMTLSLAMVLTSFTVPMNAKAASGDALKFGADGKFKILVFADTQDDTSVDARLISKMEQALKREQPDLVVFTGDQTEMNIKDPEVDFRNALEQILKPVVDAGVPYALTFGNHDDQSYYSGQRTDKDAMFAVYKTIGDCRSTDPAPELTGTGTCKIPIYGSNGSSVAFNIWMVDSGSYQDPLDTSSGYDNPHEDQLAWMKANNDAGVNSLVFQHIPMPEIYNLLVEDTNGEKSYGGKKYKLELNANATGHLGEFPCPIYAEDNRGEFAALKEMGNVLGVFTGHDHKNDFTGTYEGIDMTAVPGMTYQSYGDDAVRGYGVIELNESDLSDYEYHSVKYTEMDAWEDDSIYAPYDVITYDDLLDTGDNTLAEDGLTLTSKNNLFHYNATSPTHSAIYKLRWIAGTDQRFQIHPGGYNGSNNFAYRIYDGQWVQRNPEVKKTGYSVTQGDYFDVEVARLMVATGANAGKYYTYFKVDGTLIFEKYVDADDTNTASYLADTVQLNMDADGKGWGIAPTPEPVVYEPYDVITYSDLLDQSGKPLPTEGIRLTEQNNPYKYNATSPTHSALYQFQWVAGNDIYFQAHPGVYSSSNNFAFRINGSNWNQRNPSADKAIGYTINEGDTFNLEIGRLMVAEGKNAGKYHSYFKVNGKIIFEKYVAESDIGSADFLSDGIQFNLRDNNGRNCIVKPIEDPKPDATYYDYDEITYSDLKKNGSAVSDSGTTINGGNVFTYDATSLTYSAIFKFRWTVGADTGIQFSFDKSGTNSMSYPFGVWVKKVKDVGPNGAWHLKPTDGGLLVNMDSPATTGKTYDIEFARLKVKNGENQGKYHVYLKVNGVLIQETYSSVEANGTYKSSSNDCKISNEIVFDDWNNHNNLISDIPEPDTYEYYDVIEYYDLMENGAWLASESTMGSKSFTYNKTSTTGSAVLKFRWKAIANSSFHLSFDQAGGMNNMFGVQFYKAGADDKGFTNDSVRLRPGKDDNNAWIELASNIETGKEYDIEFARLKVKSGGNKGKYWVYFKINGELISESYVAADVVGSDGTYTSGSTSYTISNNIYLTFWGQSGNKITGIPAPETFDAYDDLTFDDLYIGSTSMDGQEISGNQTYNYKVTSPSYSMRLRYRWIPGGDELKFTAFLDNKYKFPFWFEVKTPNFGGLGAVAGPNGAWHLAPDKNSHIVNMDEPIVAGQPYDIEIGRMKVVSGAMKNKYYVYWKVNDELVFSYYYDGVINGMYEGISLSNEFKIQLPTGNKITAIPIPETFDTYDDLTFDDLYLGGEAVGDKVVDGGDRHYTYNATSSSYSAKLKFRWTAGETTKFQLHFDDWVYPFCFVAKNPYFDKLGAAAGPNGAWHMVPSNSSTIIQMEEPIVVGKSYDIEVGRLKVLTGRNAGKYYVYWKVDDELIQSYYYDGVGADGTYGDGTALSNKIIIASTDGNKFSAIPFEEKYEAYDELSFDDLYLNGKSVNGTEVDGGWKEFTYDATSSSYSMKLKYRWVPGGDELGHTTFLDANVFPFCFSVKTPNRSDFGAAAGPNGAWHLVPSNANLIVQMDEPIVAGQPYDIEIGRLKVTNGENAGKYYVYWMVNDKFIQSYYYDGVNEDGTYGNGTALSNKIIISSSAGNKFSAIPVPETYEAYDEITFDDLYLNGTSMSGQYRDDGNHTYTYNATSPSYSTKFKFRWTAGETPRFQIHFDDWVYPFCFLAKDPNYKDVGAAAGPNGAWHLVPSDGSKIVQMTSPIAPGTELDIEIGRLKVKTGANTGKYYVYWLVDGQLVQSYYYDGVVDGKYGDGTALNNKIIIASPAGNRFQAIPIPETFEEYDEISFNDLYIGDTSMFGVEADGSHDYTYKATSPSYSTKFKFRWTAGDEPRFTVYFDEWKYPFCFAAKQPNQSNFGAAAGENGAWHLVPSDSSLIVQMDKPIVTGKTYDIEVGRLKVKTGANKGKYYVYFMVNDEMIQSYYYSGVVDGVYNGVALSNKIIFSAPAGNKFSDYPFVEEYEEYDEIGYKDLTEENGDPLGSQRAMSGGTVLKYNRTSPTGSAILKYRWKVGTAPKFQLSFEKTASNAMAYRFGAWLSAPGEEANYPNGRMWLKPGYNGPEVNLSSALVSGNSYNVEFARLKVKNGPNAGKYYIYIKLDGVLIAKDYVAADVVDSDGNYTSNPGNTACTISNEIFLAFWNSEGNIISPYRALGADEHEGVLGDFDNDGAVSESDIILVRKLLAGKMNLNDLPEGIADFNNDGSVDSRDLVAIKKYFLPYVNNYEKSGSLTLGLQEHLLEDNTKTATYIADATATMGGNAYRLSRPIHSLFYVTSSNGVAVKEENMAAFREMVNALKAKGITEILYVTDSFLLPWDYADPAVNHNETVPNPATEPEEYVAWLTVNAAAFKAIAEEFPEIKFFEPYNEVNLPDNVLEKPGIPWDEEDEELIAAHTYTVEEKAAIMADLCWYITRAVRSVDIRNQVTSPSIAVGTNSIIQTDFMDKFYDAIESGNYPTGNAVADTKVDNYFTIINVHAYADYADAPKWYETDKSQNNVNTWANLIKDTYNVVKEHNDGGSRVWLTETGMSTYHPDGNKRDESRVANMVELTLKKLDQELTFIDTVIFYEVADMSWANYPSRNSETNFGLFYAGDDSSNAYKAKAIAKKIYSFFHNGSTDYSELEAFVNRYK